MSLNLDAGAFVVSGNISSPSAGTTVLLQNTPCELDVAGFQVYAGTVGSTPSSFNIKVTPPAVPAVYARTYNYNYGTGKNVAISSITTDGTTLTFTVSSSSLLAAGDVISVAGSTLLAYNLKDAVVASVTNSNGFTTSFTVKYPEPAGTATHLTGWSAIGTVSSSNVVVGSSTITFVTDNAHGLMTGDKVTVTGVTTVTAANVTAAVVTVISSTSFSVAVTTTGTPGGTAKILATIVSDTRNAIVVSKGKVADAVQLVTDVADYNVAPDFSHGTAYYAYISDQVLPLSARGATFGAASALGNSDARVAGKIPTGSKIELEIFVAGTSLANLAYGVEFKKK
jgi:hypothetical protein